MKLIIEIDEDDYTMCQILAKEMCDPRLKLTDNLKYAISNGIPLDNLRAKINAIEISGQIDEHTLFARSADGVKNMVLEIIDRYRNEVGE